jgi:hypothetical protein
MTDHSSKLDVVRESRMDMAVRMDAGTPLTEDAAARWRACRPESSAAAQAGENRFSAAWDRQPLEPFRSYRDCWPAFADDLRSLQEAFADAGADQPMFSACELDYVNPVTFEEHEPRHGRLQRLLLRWLLPEPGAGWLPTPERVVTDATFPMTKIADGPPGQLSVRWHAVAAETAEPLLGMTLSARCAVQSVQLDAVAAAFDVAFDWIVRAYATLGDPMEATR